MAVKDKKMAVLNYQSFMKKQEHTQQQRTDYNKGKVDEENVIFAKNINDKYARLVQEEKINKIIQSRAFQKHLKTIKFLE